jgi:hypothetical protein
MASCSHIGKNPLYIALLGLGVLAIAARAAHGNSHDLPQRVAHPRSAARTSAEQLLSQMAQAAGASNAAVELAIAQYDAATAEFRANEPVFPTSLSKARFLHALLHRRILQGPYQASANSVATALTGGPYNCASATAIYLALAKDFGLRAEAVAAPGHVWCRVSEIDVSFDVETTQVDWHARGRSRTPRCNSGRTLDDAGLVALVHYNQGVRLHRQFRFVDAIAANRQALAIDPHCPQARDNLLAAIHNWSVLLAASGQGVEALPAWAAGLQCDPFSITIWNDVQRWLAEVQKPAKLVGP